MNEHAREIEDALCSAARVWRAPDGGFVFAYEGATDAEIAEVLPAGSVELVPATGEVNRAEQR